jgi:hypothetical protein
MPTDTYHLVYGDRVYPTVHTFLEESQRKKEQEQRLGHRKRWEDVIDAYLAATEILVFDPFPDEDDELIKPLEHSGTYTNIYYLKIQLRNGTGHHRFLYAIHNYAIIVLLHYFDKQSKAIPAQEIKWAEANYEAYLEENPSKYDIRKEHP